MSALQKVDFPAPAGPTESAADLPPSCCPTYLLRVQRSASRSGSLKSEESSLKWAARAIDIEFCH